MLTRLWRKPLVLSSWEQQEQDDHDSHWMELFADLLYVYAASSCAETIEEDFTANNFLLFVVVGLIFVQTWVYYTQYTAKFFDFSLSHDTLLAIHLVTVMGLAVNVSNISTNHLLAGGWMVATRISMLLIYIIPFITVPQARREIGIYLISLLVSALGFLVSMFVNYQIAMILWWCIAFFEMFYWIISFIIGIKRKLKLLRIHVGHYADRNGDLIMVTVGESIVAISSAKLRNMDNYYYSCFAFAILLSFSMALAYYHTKPNEHWHALRRSVNFGFLWIICHNFLFVAFLAQACGMKWALHRASKHEIMQGYEIALFLHATVCVRLIANIIRSSHYLGRVGFDRRDPYHFAKKIWWGSLYIGIVAPYLCFLLPPDPIWILGGCFGINYGLGFIETCFTHMLDKDDSSFGHRQLARRPGEEYSEEGDVAVDNYDDDDEPLLEANNLLVQ